MPIPETRDGDFRRLPDGVLLDLLPSEGIRNPGSRGSLLGCQPRRFVGVGNAPRIDFAEMPVLTLRRDMQFGRAVGKGHVDAPRARVAGGIAPEHRGGGHLRRKDRTLQRIIDYEGCESGSQRGLDCECGAGDQDSGFEPHPAGSLVKRVTIITRLVEPFHV